LSGPADGLIQVFRSTISRQEFVSRRQKQIILLRAVHAFGDQTAVDTERGRVDVYLWDDGVGGFATGQFGQQTLRRRENNDFEPRRRYTAAVLAQPEPAVANKLLLMCFFGLQIAKQIGTRCVIRRLVCGVLLIAGYYLGRQSHHVESGDPVESAEPPSVVAGGMMQRIPGMMTAETL
jgi:hypothetical protein